MATLAAASRLSARLSARSLARSRGFRTSAAYAVAQNFTMPALSPTMTEGNIATWHVKEGDRFAAGDVLLEIETDKASMDVEAQEDGQVLRILLANGTKGIPVGARIGVLAEAGDDLATLEVPPDEPVAAAPSAPAAAAPETATATTPTTPTSAASASASAPAATSTSDQPPQKYPLLPSVARLLHERGLDPDTTVRQVRATGPLGRLLKGDVLAFLGQIPATAPAAAAARYDTLAHLDLSNIRLAPAPAKPAAAPAAEKAAKTTKPTGAAPATPTTTVVSLPVSLAAVVAVQDKIQASLGVFMPVSTFVARATAVANDALPRAGPAPVPSAAQLFDEVVGAPRRTTPSSAAGLSRGHYRPQVSALPLSAARPKPKAAAVDIIDILTGSSRAAAAPSSRAPQPLPAVSNATNFFTLAVPTAEEKRAKVFLERLKVVLENEPGQLVL